MLIRNIFKNDIDCNLNKFLPSCRNLWTAFEAKRGRVYSTSHFALRKDGPRLAKGEEV